MKKIIFFIAFILLAIILNAQSDCDIKILHNGQECNLTEYLDKRYGYLLNDMLDDFVACKGSEINYSALSNTAIHYDWNVLGGTILSGNGTNNINIRWGSESFGSIKVTITLPDGTKCEEEQNVVLVDIPTLNTAVTTHNYYIDPNTGEKIIEVCFGATVEFTDNSINDQTNITGYYWESIYSTASTKNYKIENIQQDTRVIHKIMSYCGCDTEEHFKIKVREGKNLKLSCYGTVCEGSTVVYKALNGNCSQYDWIVEGGTIINGQNTPTIEVLWSSPESGYGTIGLDGTLCDDLCNAIMSVKIPIISSQASIIGKSNVCEGDIIQYSLPLWGSTTYQWTVSPSNGVTLHRGANDNEIMLEFTSSGTYTLSSTYECEFIDCGPLTSPIKTIVVKPVLNIVSDDGNICAYSTGQFTTNSNTAVTWKIFNKYNQQIHTEQSTTLNYQFAEVGSYIVKAESPNYCNIASFAVRVSGKPSALTAGMIKGETIACPYSSISLAPQSSASIENCYLEWEPVCPTAMPQTSIGNDFTVTFAQEVCGVNVYKVDNSSGCKSDPYLYNINPFILSPSNLPNTMNVCPGEVINLSCPNQEEVFYEWLVETEERATVINDKTSPNVNVLINYMANNNYPTFYIKLKRTYCGNLISITTVQVNVMQQATPPTITSNNNCAGQNTVFTAIGGSSNPANYTWVIEGETYEGVNPARHAFNVGGYYTIQLTYTPDNGCEPVTVTQTIHVRNSPTITINRQGSILTGIILFDNDNPSGLNYNPKWITPDGHILGTTCAITTNGNYCFSVTNPNTGCTSKICENVNNCINDITFSNPVISCNTVTITANTQYNLDWSTGAAAVLSNNTHTAEITYKRAGQHYITVTTTNATPCHTGSKIITIPYIPDFKLSYDCTTRKLKIEDKSQYYPVSNQQTRTLIFAITGGYTAIIGAGQMEAFVNIPLPQNQTSYTVTLNYSGCTLQKTIDLYPAPTITSITHSGPNNTQLCEEVPYLFTATTTGSPDLKYYWDFGDGAVGKYNNNIYHTYGKKTHVILTLTVTDKNGCSATDNITLSIANNNATGGLNTIEGSPDVCPGESRVIQYTLPSSIMTYIWNPTKNPINTTPDNHEYLTYCTGDYKVRVISDIGCIGEKSVNVRFLNKPYAHISAKKKYCIGESIELISIQNTDYIYSWVVTGPNGVETLNDPDQYASSFVAEYSGNYTATLNVSTTDGCTNSINHAFTVYPKPPKPQIGYGGNPCIHTPPVVLKEHNNNNIYWSIGIRNNYAHYYTSGFATAYNVDPISGCESDNAQIFIEPAPNFDALLTGCYKKCLPANLFADGMSAQPMTWKWIFNNSVIDDYTTGSLSSLPVNYHGNYEMYVEYNNGNCNTTSPTLTIEKPDKCGCDGISITSNNKDNCYVKGCRVFYQSSIIICNNSGSTITFDQLTAMTGINIVSANVIPLTLLNGQCNYIQIDFEITDPSIDFANFSLYSSQDDCLKHFSIPIDLSNCITDKCEVELKEIRFKDNMDGILVFDFILGLPNNPSVVYSVWTEPDRIHFYNLNLPYIDGFAMFDYGDLTQMAQNGEEVCFYVLMCIKDQICKAKVCINPKYLLAMSGQKSSKSSNNTINSQGNTDENVPYLVPNPAETNVRIEGIEKTSIKEVFLIDISGKKLQEKFNSNSLDISNIPSGVYFIRVMDTSQKVNYLKLIKK